MTLETVGLSGNYSADSFVTSSDGGNGTLIAEVVNQTGTIANFLSSLSSISSAGYAIVDTSSNIAVNIDILQTNLAKIKTITLSDSNPLTITETQLISDTGVLALVGTYSLVVNNVLAADAGSIALNSHVTSLSVTDIATNITANIAALLVNTKLTSITETGTVAAITLTAAQYTSAFTAKFANFTAVVSGSTAAIAATAQADTKVTSFTVSDTAANITANLSALVADTKLTSITETGTVAAITLTAAQYTSAFTARFANFTAVVTGVTAAIAATGQADAKVSNFTVTDTAANITANLTALLADTKLTSITQSDAPTALSITAAQSVADHAVLAKIAGTYYLTVTGTAAADTLTDTANSHAALTGGAGLDTFNVSGTDTITDLGNGGADIVKIVAGGSVTASLAAAWTATATTSNAAATAANAVINTNGFNVSVAAAIGADGWTLNATGTGTGTTSLTGSINNDTINGDAAGGLTINGAGGTDTLVLGTHTSADTIYLVANALENITGFGSSTGTVADGLNVTATGNALAGLTLKNDTTLATNNVALAANSTGLVFGHADAGTALTAATAAALFSDVQAVGKYAIATGTGLELLIETGATTTSNVVWEIKDTAGVFTAIELTGVTVVAGHNLAFANFH